MARRRLKKKVKRTLQAIILILLLGVLALIGSEAYKYYQTDNQELEPIEQKKYYYSLYDFGYAPLRSKKDYNNNGQDDYADFLKAEKAFAKFNPKYKSSYYAGGYPPVEKEGVSSDLIWYAFKEAGYDLKSLVSKDISKNSKKYYASVSDENIDFRRVANLDVFFSRYAKSLTIDMYKIGEFMPGDILVFDYDEHIAMVSDKYTKDGVPYIISNRNEKQTKKEENILEKTSLNITGHYRFEYNKKIEKLINS